MANRSFSNLRGQPQCEVEQWWFAGFISPRSWVRKAKPLRVCEAIPPTQPIVAPLLGKLTYNCQSSTMSEVRILHSPPRGISSEVEHVVSNSLYDLRDLDSALLKGR
jgi:hypothetical protein